MTLPIYVPGEGPASPTYMIIGEAPGEKEEKGLPQDGFKPRPFIGPVGWLMRHCLQRVGIRESETYFTNVCHYRPPGNQINVFIPKKRKTGRTPNDLVRAGLAELYKDIAERKPKIIIPMGNIALWALTGHEQISKRRGTVYPVQVDINRIYHASGNYSAKLLGDIFKSVIDHKCIPTYHPSAVSRNYPLKVLFEMDLLKAKREATYPDVRWPKRDIFIDPDLETATALAHKLLEAGRFAFDIETPSGQLYCVGFSCDPRWALVLRTDAQWKCDLIRILLESDAQKIAHNGLFDSGFGLFWGHYDVKNYTYDTMYAHKIFYPDFKVGLDFQTAFYTDEPYYKDEGKDIDLSKFEDEQQYLLYNGKDACVTMECAQKQERLELKRKANADSWAHHAELLPIARKMMIRGLRVDMDKLHELRRTSIRERDRIQFLIDVKVLEHLAAAAQNTKIDPKTREQAGQLAVSVMKNMQAGEAGLNTMSGKDVMFYLYKIRGFKVKNKKTPRGTRPTADEKALKEIYGETMDDTVLLFCKNRRERTLLSRYYAPHAVQEGRMPFSVNPCGTKTTRWTAGQTIIILAPRKKKRKKEKTGANVQTLPYIVREMIVPDPGYVMFYADLEQVEDRIVAYAGGVKKKIDAFERGINPHDLTASGVFACTIEEVIAEKKKMKAAGREPPRYFLGKQSNHAYNYGEGPITFMRNVNKKADETGIRVTLPQSRGIRAAHFSLYPEIETGYWEWIKETLRERKMRITNPFGYEYQLLGRPDDEATFRDAYSRYPQSTPPEIINRGMVRIHKELPEVDILLHMHDAILGQIPEGLAGVYGPKILELMDEPLYVRQHTIHIPVGMKMGERWSKLG